MSIPVRNALTAADVARRRPVWDVLSEFWLDTELSHDDHVRIAAVLRESGFSVHELEVICREEVSPVVSGNLLSVAGEWAGFDSAWLSNAILEHLRHPSVYARLLKALGLGRPGALLGAARHWRAVSALLTAQGNDAV